MGPRIHCVSSYSTWSWLSPSSSLLCPGLMQTNALILPSWGWQFASCRDISSSLAPCHLSTNAHPTQDKTKVAWPVWNWSLREGMTGYGVLMVLWVRSKWLMGMLASKLFNHVRHHSTFFKSLDSNSDFLFPNQLEIVFFFLQTIVFAVVVGDDDF